MTHKKPKPTWKAWTEHEGDTQVVYVSIDRRGHSIRVSQPLAAPEDLGTAILEMIAHVRTQAINSGWTL